MICKSLIGYSCQQFTIHHVPESYNNTNDSNCLEEHYHILKAHYSQLNMLLEYFPETTFSPPLELASNRYAHSMTKSLQHKNSILLLLWVKRKLLLPGCPLGSNKAITHVILNLKSSWSLSRPPQLEEWYHYQQYSWASVNLSKPMLHMTLSINHDLIVNQIIMITQGTKILTPPLSRPVGNSKPFLWEYYHILEKIQ